MGHSVVVVGASDVGVAAVQQLVQIPNLRLNNLTFVSDTFHDDYLTNVEGVQVLPTPIKSAKDTKDYKQIKLPNGLKALLISDTSDDFRKNKWF